MLSKAQLLEIRVVLFYFNLF